MDSIAILQNGLGDVFRTSPEVPCVDHMLYEAHILLHHCRAPCEVCVLASRATDILDAAQLRKLTLLRKALWLDAVLAHGGIADVHRARAVESMLCANSAFAALSIEISDLTTFLRFLFNTAAKIVQEVRNLAGLLENDHKLARLALLRNCAEDHGLPEWYQRAAFVLVNSPFSSLTYESAKVFDLETFNSFYSKTKFESYKEVPDFREVHRKSAHHWACGYDWCDVIPGYVSKMKLDVTRFMLCSVAYQQG